MTETNVRSGVERHALTDAARREADAMLEALEHEAGDGRALVTRVFARELDPRVEAMVERGLVTKEPNPSDARSWLVTLTDEGVSTVTELNQTLDSHAEQLLGSLNTRERAAVENSLLLLMKALREDTAANCCLPPAERKETKSCC